MRTLYVVVHPEATHHAEHVTGGWHDSYLTSNGLRAAGSIALALKSQFPEDAQPVLYSSDLARAKETAEEIASVLQICVNTDARLREKSYRIAEGKPDTFLAQHLIPPPASSDRMGHYEGIEGSETKRQWAGRIYEAMDDILSADAERQIVVTHGGSITFVIAAWIKMPLESMAYVNFKASASSITILTEDDFWHNRQVTVLGDVRHLEKEQEKKVL